MSVTNAKAALQAAENTFNIQKGDTRAQSILKFAGGSAAKIAVMGIAGFEYGLSKVGSLVPTSKAQNLTEYANEAAQTFVDAAKSMDKPFAPEKKEAKGFFGFGKKSTIVEGPTVSSYVRAGLNKAKETASDASSFAAKNKGTIAAGVALAAGAITLYYFGPSLFSKAAETAAQNSPVQGPVNMPVFGPENMPVQGPVNMPVFGPENMPVQGPVNMPVFGPENMPVQGPVNMPVFGPENMPVQSLVVAAPAPTPVTLVQTLALPSSATNITAPVVQLNTSGLSSPATNGKPCSPFDLVTLSNPHPFGKGINTESFQRFNTTSPGAFLPSFNMTALQENPYIKGIIGFGSKAKSFFASLPSLLPQLQVPTSSNSAALVAYNATNAALQAQSPALGVEGMKNTIYGGGAATFALTLLATCCFRRRRRTAPGGAIVASVVPSNLGLSKNATKKLKSWINQGKDLTQTTFGRQQLTAGQVAQFRAYHNL